MAEARIGSKTLKTTKNLACEAQFNVAKHKKEVASLFLHVRQLANLPCVGSIQTTQVTFQKHSVLVSVCCVIKKKRSKCHVSVRKRKEAICCVKEEESCERKRSTEKKEQIKKKKECYVPMYLRIFFFFEIYFSSTHIPLLILVSFYLSMLSISYHYLTKLSTMIKSIIF